MKAATHSFTQCEHGANISIHAAREGGDDDFVPLEFKRIAFQSTPPVKAATTPDGQTYYIAGFQSTPPVKAATLTYSATPSASPISIHAAREGGDDNVKN